MKIDNHDDLDDIGWPEVIVFVLGSLMFLGTVVFVVGVPLWVGFSRFFR